MTTTETSLINKSETRRVILARLDVIRPALVGKLTRVSEDTLNYLDSRLRNLIDNELRAHGTCGATIRMGER